MYPHLQLPKLLDCLRTFAELSGETSHDNSKLFSHLNTVTYRFARERRASAQMSARAPPSCQSSLLRNGFCATVAYEQVKQRVR